MRKLVLLIAAIIAFITMGIISCDNRDVKTKETGSISNDSLAKRGEYLVKIMGCDDCHSPKIFGPQGPELDMEHRLSGYPADRPLTLIDTNVIKKGWALFNGDLTEAAGPWGVSFSANITSDSTGIGAWTEDQFKKALREGKLKGLDGTRPLLPPMPWQNYKNLEDEDLKAIFTFLKSTKAVKNIVPQAKQLSNL